jgi:hypothetical protein
MKEFFKKNSSKCMELEIQENVRKNVIPRQNGLRHGLCFSKEECKWKCLKRTAKNTELRQRKENSGGESRVTG